MNIRSRALAWYRHRYDSGDRRVKASRLYPSKLSWTKTPAWAFLIPIKDLQAEDSIRIELLCQKQEEQDDFYVLKVPSSYLLQQLPHLDVRRTKSGDAIRLFIEAAGTGQFSDCHTARPVSLSAFLLL